MYDSGLVSVVVIAFNSSKTIIETLESIKLQTYSEIELLISDDFSTDDTVEKSREWLQSNNERFCNVMIVEAPYNTGIPANLNRGIKHVKGEFVKIIAADDVLMTNCISDNVEYMLSHNDAMILFSKCKIFSQSDKIDSSTDVLPRSKDLKKIRSSAKEQLMYLYLYNYIPACTCFVRSVLYQSFIYDEAYRLFEDTPFYVKLAKNGILLHFLDKETVYYRAEESLSTSKKNMVNENLHYFKKLWFYKEISLELRSLYPVLYNYCQIKYFLEEFQLLLLSNKNCLFNRIVVFMLKRYFRKQLEVDIHKYL